LKLVTLSITPIVEATRLSRGPRWRRVEESGEIAIADDFRMRIFESEHPNGEADLLAMRINAASDVTGKG
jgi:hypothetical protein